MKLLLLEIYTCALSSFFVSWLARAVVYGHLQQEWQLWVTMVTMLQDLSRVARVTWMLLDTFWRPLECGLASNYSQLPLPSTVRSNSVILLSNWETFYSTLMRGRPKQNLVVSTEDVQELPFTHWINSLGPSGYTLTVICIVVVIFFQKKLFYDLHYSSVTHSSFIKVRSGLFNALCCELLLSDASNFNIFLVFMRLTFPSCKLINR